MQHSGNPDSPARQYLAVDTQPARLDQVDWAASPRPWKLYRGSNPIQLGYTTSADPTHSQRDAIGQLLRDVYGITRLQWWRSNGPLGPPNPDNRLTPLYRRPVPAGGGLFSSEVYMLVGALDDLPAGVYHYDAVHHTLDVLRAGNHGAWLHDALAQPSTRPPLFALLLTSCFYKNGFKYGELSYRLQCLDLGVVLAQTLTTAPPERWQMRVHYQFLDTALAELLGLALDQESVYAVVTFHSDEPSHDPSEHHTSTPDLAPLMASPFEPMESIRRWPLSHALHQASLHSRAADWPTAGLVAPPAPVSDQAAVPLPDVDVPLDLRRTIQRRRSAWNNFYPDPLSRLQLARLLQSCTQPYLNDLTSTAASRPHTLVYCVVNAVDQIEPGVYCYDSAAHTCRCVLTGDLRAQMHMQQRQPDQQIYRVSVCLFPVIRYEEGFAAYGDRWYRIQNMEAGLQIQRLALGAAALDLGCQVTLGYDVPRMNAVLGVPPGWTSAAQVMIAAERLSSRSYEQLL